jgi:transcriptional regulator with XRE-family HTH domain
MRFAQARWLLSFARREELSQSGIAKLANVSGNAWNEWERNISYPQPTNLGKVLALFVREGMPYITAKWLDYGIEGEGFPQIVTMMVEVVSVLTEMQPTTDRQLAAGESAKRGKQERRKGA